MNERITKIVIDTLGKEGVVNHRAFGHWALSDEELEKFAELLVKECADVAKQFYKNNKDYNAGLAIEQHFGIEE